MSIRHAVRTARVLAALSAALCLSAVTWAAPPAKAAASEQRPQVGAQAKAYRGPEGLKLTVLRFGPESDNNFLLQFQGIDNPWNDKWLLSHRSHAGTGYNYVVKVKGEDYTAIVERGESSGWKRMQAYIPSGVQGADLSYDEQLSQEVEPEHALTAYLEQKGK